MAPSLTNYRTYHRCFRNAELSLLPIQYLQDPTISTAGHEQIGNTNNDKNKAAYLAVRDLQKSRNKMERELHR
jgi:hypothetical protein